MGLKKGANTLLKDNEGREPKDAKKVDNADTEPPRKKRKVSPERERVGKNLAKEFEAVDDRHRQRDRAERGHGHRAEGSSRHRNVRGDAAYQQSYQAQQGLGGRRRGLRSQV